MPTNTATSVGAIDAAEASRCAAFRLVRGMRHDLTGIAWADLDDEPTAVCVKSNELRQVWRVERGGEVFYAKIFRNIGGWEALRLRLRGRPEMREWQAGQCAEQLGVPAIRFAALLEPTRSDGDIRSVLVSYAVPKAITLTDFWQRIPTLPDPPDRARQYALVIDAVARLVGDAHARGFLHRDTYSDNLLIVLDECRNAVEALYADLGQARGSRPIAGRRAAANLAELAQWFRTRSTTGQQLRFLSRYLSTRFASACGEKRRTEMRVVRRRFARQVGRLARRRQQRLIAKRDSRIFRNNNHFHTIRFDGGWRGVFTLRFRQRQMAPRPSQPDRTPAEWAEWTRRALTAGPDAAGIAVALDQLGLAARIYRPCGFRERIFWAFWGSSARRAFRTGHQLRNRDLPVAAPIAVLERRAGGFVTEAILITEPEGGGLQT